MIGANAPRMLSIALPHVDAWNTWFTPYGNTRRGLRRQNARDHGAPRSAPGATRRSSSGAPACSSRSSRRRRARRATSRRCRPTGSAAHLRALGAGGRGRGDPRRSTRSRSRRSARFEQRFPAAEQRLQILARLAVRGEQVGVAPVGRRAAARARRRAPRRARPPASTSSSASRLRLRRPLRLLALRLCGGGAGAASRLLRARVVRPAARVRRDPRGPRPRAGGPATASSSARSCETSSTVPGNASSAASSDSRDSRSRWFVGSSSTRRVRARRDDDREREPAALAARQHRDRLLVLVPAREEEAAEQRLRLGPLQARCRTSPRRAPSRARRARPRAVRSTRPRRRGRAGPSRSPGSRRPSIVSSSVVLPEPFGPTSATCSPRSIANDAPFEELLVARPQRQALDDDHVAARPRPASGTRSRASGARSSGACTRIGLAAS